jgi:3-hydroxyisobutyrate dehydrogenase-like beta-hydroxyacid dehydrogenase
MMRMGFIGVGLMGQGMAECLLKAGHALVVSAHSNHKPIEQLILLGAEEVADATAVAESVDVLFLCLPNADTVLSVMNQIMPALRIGALVIDTSTSLPERSSELAARLRDRGVGFVDAPVTGGPEGAAAGTLTSMVGGYEPDYQRALSLINCYSESVVYFGTSGSGNKAKLIHNFITTGQVALIVEAMRCCDKAGLDRAQLYEVLSQGGASSKTLSKLMPSALAGSYDGHRFTLENASKDVDYMAYMLAQLKEQSRIIEGLQQFYHQELEHYPKDTFLSGLLKNK